MTAGKNTARLVSEILKMHKMETDFSNDEEVKKATRTRNQEVSKWRILIKGMAQV